MSVWMCVCVCVCIARIVSAGCATRDSESAQVECQGALVHRILATESWIQEGRQAGRQAGRQTLHYIRYIHTSGRRGRRRRGVPEKLHCQDSELCSLARGGGERE